MKRILCSDWLPEMGQSCPLRIAHFVPTKAKFFGVIFWPYHKSFIDQATSVKMAGYWPRSFFFFLRFYGPRLRFGPSKRKQRTWPISSHFDLTLGQEYIFIGQEINTITYRLDDQLFQMH